MSNSKPAPRPAEPADTTGVDPRALRIVSHPHPVLRQKARPIAAVTDTVRAVAQRMIELMHEAEGVGLAAPQVALPWRMFVVDVPPNEERSPDDDPPTCTAQPVVYINPVIFEPSRDLVPYEEGCLSLPDIRGEVRRPSMMSIRALDLNGREFTTRGDDLLARCWQHELDHLDGVLILDRMTQTSKLKVREAVRALEGRAR